MIDRGHLKVLLFLLIFLHSSFFWEDEEKELRNLHQTAELAMKSRDFTGAKEAFQAILKKVNVSGIQKHKIDWQTYFDISMRLAEAHEFLEERDDGEKVLVELLSQNPPKQFIPHIKLLLARLTAGQNSPEKAFKMMQSIAETFPLKMWRSGELSFFHALEFALDEHYNEMLQKAKRFFVTGYYQSAIPLYEEILQAIEDRTFPKANSPESLIQKKVRFRLAECYYCQAKVEKALSLIVKEDQLSDQIDREMIYLSALCFKEKHEYERALEQFLLYTKVVDHEHLSHYNHAIFEIGLHFYQAKNFNQAKNYFENLQKQRDKKEKSIVVAALYLARIYLEESYADQVDPLLTPFSYLLNQDDPLKYELFYLRGMAAYQMGKYSAARDFFERSLPSNQRGQWSLQACFQLGLCYMKLGDDPSKRKDVRMSLFHKAEEVFKKLILTNESEVAVLALARLYLTYDSHFHDLTKRQQVSQLISTNQNRLSKEGSLEALLLCAEAEESFEGREKLYEIATDESFQNCAAYCDAWHARGLNYFKQGLQEKDQYFELATSALEKAFHVLEKKDEKRAGRILKLEAKANFFRHSPISSLALLEKLLNNFHEENQEREETLYLHGLVASQLTDFYYFPIAEESFLHIVDNYPNGEYADKALYMLGTLYYRQENYSKSKDKFLELTSLYPCSNCSGDAWFWAAEAAKKLNDREQEVQHYYHCAYTYYPNSPHASEAYYRQYDYSEYLNGVEEAILHLKKFASIFPSSPYLTVSSYLLGKNCSELMEAEIHFKEAIQSFQSSLVEGKIPETPFIYFRYRAALELALLHLKDQNVEKAIGYLTHLIGELSDETHPLTSLLKSKTPYPSIFEESEFALAQCFLRLEKVYQAQETFSSMLNHYAKAGIVNGQYLSHVWCEQAKLAIQCQDLETALSCFKIAEECGEGYLTDDQRLSLWIMESDCYLKKGELDIAMRMLSKAINETVSSPLRLKAMYLRSEIYEMQGRPELAIRQLEAMSKKGGEWSMKAEEKLRSRYGME